jgi:hypothetical protein
MVSLPNGSQIAAHRTKPLLLDVAGTTEDVVGMMDSDCILGLPWLRDANPVVSWEYAVACKNVFLYHEDDRCGIFVWNSDGLRPTSNFVKKSDNMLISKH